MYITSLQQEVNSYSHVIKAFGGYWSAKFTILDKQEDMESWLIDGLGRHIEVYDNALVKIWEGFVNQVDLTLGGLTATRGPLLDVANRVRVVYSGTNTETDPPVQGNRVMTAAVNDLESQGKYGIIEQVLSAGGMTLMDAEQARDSYMAENALPRTIQKLGSGGGLNVSVSCLGYVHLLNYLISLVGVDGTINLDTKLQQVLDADPNGLFASSNSGLMPNLLQVPAYDNKSRAAWDVIKELVALGDEADVRYILGVYADRHVSYQPTNQDEIAYKYFPGDPARRIESSTGGNVWPWNVVPGGWMFFPSFLVGETFPDDWHKDPRFMFIESVTFRLPHMLQLQGGRLDTIPQKLAKMGLAGIGA